MSFAHELRIEPESYDVLEKNIKTFEIRNNKNRNFQVGDILILREYNAETRMYTGKICRRTVTYVTNYLQMSDYVVMAIKE